MELLKIDGIVIRNLTGYAPLLSQQDGENSGRNPNLDMNRDILGRIVNITVKVGYCYQDEMKQLLSLLNNPQMQVEYFLPEIGAMISGSFYCVDPKPIIKSWNPVVYEEMEFVLVSNGRYD